MSEVRVEAVNREAGYVEIMVLNILFNFRLKADGKLSYTKSKPGARVYDPADMRVPDWAFKDACRQAGKILRDEAKKKKRGK